MTISKDSKLSRGVSLWIAVFIILVTIFLFVASYLRYINVSFVLGPYRFSHWLTLVGTTFLILYTPIYLVWKRLNPNLFLPLLRVHVFGNLISVALITVHFAGQIDRPQQSYPELGTGIVLYAVMILMVVTGFVQRFQLVKRLRYWRFFHVGMVITFYLVIVLHILHGLKVI